MDRCDQGAAGCAKTGCCKRRGRSGHNINAPCQQRLVSGHCQGATALRIACRAAARALVLQVAMTLPAALVDETSRRTASNPLRSTLWRKGGGDVDPTCADLTRGRRRGRRLPLIRIGHGIRQYLVVSALVTHDMFRAIVHEWCIFGAVPKSLVPSRKSGLSSPSRAPVELTSHPLILRNT